MLKIKLQQITDRLNAEIDPYDTQPVYDLNDDHISDIVMDMVTDYTVPTYRSDKVQLYLDIMDVMCSVLAAGLAKVGFYVSVNGNMIILFLHFEEDK